MNEFSVLVLIVSILAISFLVERTLAWLNYRHWSEILPAELNDVYDAEAYLKSQRYKKENDRLEMVTSSFSFLLTLAMFVFGGFAWLDEQVRQLTHHDLLVSLLFFGILYVAADLLSTPFAVYDTFVIEEKYGFNKTTPRLFVIDKLKGYMLTFLIGGGLLTLFILFYQYMGPYFWVYAWAGYTFFMILMQLFYSDLIVPLFNKQTPLEDGELKQAIEELCRTTAFPLKEVYVIDGSKRSSKANAYFTGLGVKKRIVLYDTLIQQLSVPEIVAVLGHEIGHYKRKHTLKHIIFSVVQNGITLYLLSVFLNYPVFVRALGVNQPALHMGMVIFAVLYSPVSMAVGVCFNILSRRHEYEADAFVKQHGMARHLVSALKKLSRHNYSNLTPHPAYVFFYYSHPPLLQRIRALND